jgi:hypothetical protein
MAEIPQNFDPEANTSPELETTVASSESGPKRDGWQDETEARKASVNLFISKHIIAQRAGTEKVYDTAELHVSGANPNIFPKIVDGTANVSKVSVLYTNGKPEQIHVLYPTAEGGQSIDVYLVGQALADYLASEAT